MSTPGMSLFHGGETMQINASLERAQEEEELEDQRRRTEELGDLLQNAFDDLDEEESTLDTSVNPIQPNSQFPIWQAKQNACNFPGPPILEMDEDELHRLRMVIESQTHELENMRAIASEKTQTSNDLQKRLTMAEAELDRLLSTKNNTHELLVESKEKCSNLESIIAKLRNEKKAIETEHNIVLGKLETSQTLLADVQRKFDMVERDLTTQNDRNADMRRKHIEERHRAEMEVLHQQMDQLANKLDKKTTELENMSTRYNALQNSHEKMLLDKATKINDLNHALVESQDKCEELLRKEDYFQENVRLQKLVASLQRQIEGMEKTINSLTKRLDFTTAELDIMDSVLQQHNKEDTPHSLTQAQNKLIGSTPLTSADRMSNLKEELYRALANVKGKREEIRLLQQSLDDKGVEIRILKDEENKSLVLITTLKEDKIRMENRLKVLEDELQQQRNKSLNSTDNKVTINDLLNQVSELKAKIVTLDEQRTNLERNRDERETECKKLNTQLNNVIVDLEELKQEYDSMKQNYDQLMLDNKLLVSSAAENNTLLELEKHKILLKDAKTERSRLKTLYVDLMNSKEALSYELEKIKNSDNCKEVHEQRERAANLQRALQLSEVKSSELMKLLESEKLSHERDLSQMQRQIEKEKSTIKEISGNCGKCIDYISDITKLEIQTLNISNLNTLSKQKIDELSREVKESKEIINELNEKLKLSEHQEKLITELKTKAHEFEEYIRSHSSASEKSAVSDKSVGTSPQRQKTEVMKIESRIRDEMAKIVAVDIKRYQMIMQNLHAKITSLQQELNEQLTQTKDRENDVNLLKQVILVEREELSDILKENENEKKIITKNQHSITQKYIEELRNKNDRIKQLNKSLTERQKQIEAERQSMKVVMTQWETQSRNVDEIENEWKNKLSDLEVKHKTDLENWHTKYNSAKRTAFNYKRYAEDKEVHMNREYERIKKAYDNALINIEARIKEQMETKNLQMMETLQKLEKDKENVPRN